MDVLSDAELVERGMDITVPHPVHSKVDLRATTYSQVMTVELTITGPLRRTLSRLTGRVLRPISVAI